MGLTAVAAIFRPEAAAILFAALACTAALPAIVRRSPPLFAGRPRPARRGRSRRAVRLRPAGEARVFDGDLERVSAVMSVRPVETAPAREIEPEQPRVGVVQCEKPAVPSPPVREPVPSVGAVERPKPAPDGASEQPDAAYRQGCQLEQSGDLAAAEQAFADATARGHRLAALSLGQLLQARGELGEAASSFRRAAEGTDSLAGTAALSLGVLLASGGDERGAVAAYERAIRCGGGPAESAVLLLRWLQHRREAA